MIPQDDILAKSPLKWALIVVVSTVFLALCLRTFPVPNMTPDIYHIVPTTALGLGALKCWLFNEKRVFLSIASMLHFYWMLIGLHFIADKNVWHAAKWLALYLANVNILLVAITPKLALAPTSYIKYAFIGLIQSLWLILVVSHIEDPHINHHVYNWVTANQAYIIPVMSLIITLVTWGYLYDAFRKRPTTSGLMYILCATTINTLPLLWGHSLQGSILLALCGFAIIFTFMMQSRKIVFVDHLTGVGSRRSLDHRFTTLTGRYHIAMVDLDHFKRINDQYGHAVGDEVLSRVGETLKASFSNKQVYRFGGEEFTVILQHVSARTAKQKLEKFRRQTMQDNVVINNQLSLNVTVSIGLCSSHPALPPKRIVEMADNALYRAKAQGRNMTCQANVLT